MHLQTDPKDLIVLRHDAYITHNSMYFNLDPNVQIDVMVPFIQDDSNMKLSNVSYW